MKDATDRNRTSPFAFTGNKFEFRMVGSQDSVSQPNVVLNTIVAEAFAEACDELEKADDFDMAVHDLIKKYATEHQRIVFNGNGYSDEWVEEAERRGLPNIKSMVDAIPALNTEKAVALFEKFGVFTKAELDSRVEIEYETYAKEINIEANDRYCNKTDYSGRYPLYHNTGRVYQCSKSSLWRRYQRADRDSDGSIRPSCRHEECAFKIRGSDCTGCSYGTGKRAGSILSR